MKRAHVKTLLQSLFVLGVFVFVFYFAYLAQESDTIKNLVLDYGYLGIFVVALISGFNLVVPIPAIAFMPLFLGAGLDFWVTITVITIGITIADSFAYWIGVVGYDAFSGSSKNKHKKKTFFNTLVRIKKKHAYAPLVVLFFYSIIAPLPNELMVIPMGLLGYRYVQIFPIVLVGNFIFNTIYATGVESLFQFIL